MACENSSEIQQWNNLYMEWLATSTFTRACFQVSRLLELQLQIRIMDQLTFPNINNPTWIRKLFLLVTNGQPEQSFGDAELSATYASFKYTLGQYVLQNMPMTSQIITYVVSQIIRNIILHIPSQYQAMSSGGYFNAS
jgi:hypothetical protein